MTGRGAVARAKPPKVTVTGSSERGPVVLVAGARSAAVHALLNAMLAPHRLPHTPRDRYLVISGSAPDQEHSSAAEAMLPVLPARARRIDATVPDPMLDVFTAIGVRAVTPAQGEDSLAVALLARCDALVLVTDGRLPFQPAELDLLRAARQRRQAVFVAMTHVDERAGWPEVVEVNQALLAREARDLALRPWYAVGRAGSDAPELRRALFGWATSVPRPGARRPRAIAPRIRPDAAGSGWREVLSDAIERERAAVAAWANHMIDDLRLAGPQTDPSDPAGGAGLAAQDRPCAAEDSTGPAVRLAGALQSASVALAADLTAATDRILALVLAEVLSSGPDAAVLDRVRSALRRDVARRSSDLARCYRALRITRTGIVAVSTSREPVAALLAHAGPDSGVLPPLGIGLTANCFPGRPTAESCGAEALIPSSPWIARCVEALAIELPKELDRQFAQLHQSIADLVSDSIDHDVLLT